MKHKICNVFFILVSSFSFQALGNWEVGALHIQDGGRVKPFDTFARESLQLIHGKRSFRGKDAVDVVITWMLAPEPWDDIELLEVRHSGLRQALRLPAERTLFQPKELLQNDKLALVLTELRTERDKGGKLNPYYQAVSRLENQLALFMAIKSGEAVRLVPPKEGTTWLSITTMPDDLKQAFVQMGSSYAKSLSGDVDALQRLSQDAASFHHLAQAQNPEQYGPEWRNQVEMAFNALHPFRIAWGFYLAFILCWAFLQMYPRPVMRWLTGATFTGGFLVHLAGIILRCLIIGRPPVSNMYETVVWVPFGVLVIALVLARIYNWLLPVVMSSAVAILCLILTDLAPVILDASLNPLEPVLRSNFWLSTHVLIITLSYAGFFLAFALGDLSLYYYVRGPQNYLTQIKACTTIIYRSIQVGVVLLALGIILGGIWADYSWGRFWGWDPKETWALIALLGYLAILHGRLIGWVRDFGMAAGSVIAFSLVIMAWYGVNYVLGAGLHSYGFGAGGIEYVTGFVALHALFVLYVWMNQAKQQKAST